VTAKHPHGFSLGTLDNPGWSVTDDLNDTSQEDQSFDELRIEGAHALEWTFVRKESSTLKGTCGPRNPEHMVSFMSAWLRPMV
jgi:hypothetical protein